MHLVLSSGEAVQVVHGEHQGRVGTIARLMVAVDRKSYYYTVKLKGDQRGGWASLTLRFSHDQIKKVRTY